jgi:hypothetical protein
VGFEPAVRLRYPHSARISRNRSAASRRDSMRRDRSNRTFAHANAAILSLISTADSIRPVAASFTVDSMTGEIGEEDACFEVRKTCVVGSHGRAFV